MKLTSVLLIIALTSIALTKSTNVSDTLASLKEISQNALKCNFNCASCNIYLGCLACYRSGMMIFDLTGVCSDNIHPHPL
jgi:hypothetical protein